MLGESTGLRPQQIHGTHSGPGAQMVRHHHRQQPMQDLPLVWNQKQWFQILWVDLESAHYGAPLHLHPSAKGLRLPAVDWLCVRLLA